MILVVAFLSLIQKHLHEEDQDAIMLIEVKQNERIPSQIHYVHRFPRNLTADDLYLPVGEPHKLQTISDINVTAG